MKAKKRSAIKLCASVLTAILIVTALRVYFTYQDAHLTLSETSEMHINKIRNDVSFAVEQVYAVQALVMGAEGKPVDLDSIGPILARDQVSQYIRSIALAPGGVVEQVFPAEENQALIGADLLSAEHPSSDLSHNAQNTRNLVLTSPFTLPSGERVVAARLPVYLPNDDGTYNEWGFVSVSMAFPQVLGGLEGNAPPYPNYAFRVLLEHANNESPREILNYNFSGYKHSVVKEFSLEDNTIILQSAPSEGWFSLTNTIDFFLKLVVLAVLIGPIVEYLVGKIKKVLADATEDELTGLLNRSTAHEHIEHITHSKGFRNAAFIMLDIDHFKDVNDKFGHQRGDEVLKSCATLFRRLFRDNDVLCRLGGDEFVFFLPYTDDSSFLNDKVNKLLRSMDQEIVSDGSAVHISASIGVALAPEHGVTFEDLYHNADDALYRAKALGRNCAVLCDGTFTIRGREGDIKSPRSEYRDRSGILIVDPSAEIRSSIKEVFSSHYQFIESDSCSEGLELAKKRQNELCAILVSHSDPAAKSLDMLRELYAQEIPFQIPTFLITDREHEDTASQAYELGVMDVITKPLSPAIILRRVQTVIELYRAREILQATVTGQEHMLRENAETIDELHKSTIQALASAIEFRDVESGEHTNRIYDITKHILTHTEMGEGFTASQIESIAIGSIMHDVGKIAISDVILNKPGKLTFEEFEIMKTHTTMGAALLAQLSKTQSHDAYRYAQDIAHHHHERWDGGGYPEGLKGDEITVWSQIVSIADVYDALISRRVYKEPFEPEIALDMIRDGQCGVFNPKLLECFFRVEPVIRQWYIADTKSRPARFTGERIEAVLTE